MRLMLEYGVEITYAYAFCHLLLWMPYHEDIASGSLSSQKLGFKECLPKRKKSRAQN